MEIGFFTDAGPASGHDTLYRNLCRYAPASVRITPFRGRPGVAGLAFGEIVARAQSSRIELVHLASHGPIAIAALYVAWKMQVPLVASVDTTLARGTGIQKAYVRSLFHCCDRLFVSSVLARRRVMRIAVPGRKVLLWRPGVDSSTFAPAKRSAALRMSWGVSDSRAAVVYAGRLTADAGLALLAALEGELHRTVPVHRLIVVGDGPYRAELQRLCGNAKFLGTVSHDAMPEIFASADIVVRPGNGDSTAHTVLEAQASGVPCVVMKGSSAAERIATASGVACDSLADFIVHTASLIRHADRRKAMAAAARAHAVSQPCATGMMPFYATYRSVVEASLNRKLIRVVGEDRVNA